MCFLQKFILTAFLVSLQREISCLKDVVLDIEPRVVQLGKDSTLRCSYDLEDVQLYSVKWYRGQHEFYRYTPSEIPSTKTFRLPGVDVNLEQSNEHQVVLRNVGFNLSGKFSCEVTADAPFFVTKTVSKDMLVVVLPSDPPVLTTEKSYYDAGDVLRANCTSSLSRPATTLTFIVSNIIVCEACETKKHSNKSLWWSELSLELPLFPSHFPNGQLRLKCEAKIRDLYQQDTSISFSNVKDPVPARVTQSSVSLSTPVISIILLNALFTSLFN